MSTISIIGSGTMATAVAGRIANAGHTVEVVNRDAAKAQELASKLAAGAICALRGKHAYHPASAFPCSSRRRTTSVIN